MIQTVLYLGRDPLRLESRCITPSLEFRYDLVNLREFDAAPVLAKGDKEKELAIAIYRLHEMNSEDRAWASGALLLLSGILGIEDTVHERMKEAGMIDLMENKVLGPMILQAEQKGRSEGRQEGRQEGMHGLLLDLLTEKFGALPEWAIERLRTASGEELHAWAKRALHSSSLAETLQ